MTEPADQARELEELLQPTVAPLEHRELPWRVQSQFWVAFFGGILAVTAIAWLNSRRLGAPPRKQQLIILAGILATAGLVSFLLLNADESRQVLRVAGRVGAVALFLALAWIQRADDRRHQIFGSGKYASLWKAGIAASIVGAIVLVLVVVGARMLLP